MGVHSPNVGGECRFAFQEVGGVWDKSLSLSLASIFLSEHWWGLGWMALNVPSISGTFEGGAQRCKFVGFFGGGGGIGIPVREVSGSGLPLCWVLGERVCVHIHIWGASACLWAPWVAGVPARAGQLCFV